jgi:hypothetical protein
MENIDTVFVGVSILGPASGSLAAGFIGRRDGAGAGFVFSMGGSTGKT